MKRAIYIHGLASGQNSRTGKLLRQYLPQYDWTLPELTHHYGASIKLLRETIDEVHPDLVIGTSLGGYYAICVSDRIDSPVILVNPVIDAQHDIMQFVGTNRYFCKRQDGVKTFVVTPEDCMEYASKEDVETLIDQNKDHIHTFYSTHDQLLGMEYKLRYLELFGDRAMASDLMGHSITEEFVREELVSFVTTELS